MDAAAAGPGDGSEGAPFTTLGEAVLAASNGATIAIAAGAYGNVVVDKAVTLWGRCPAMVHVSGGLSPGIFVAAAGATVRGMRIDGEVGLWVEAPDVVVSDLWIYEAAPYGLYAAPGATVTATNVLIEGTVGDGLLSLGASTELVRSVVRDSTRFGIGTGDGSSVVGSPVPGSMLRVERSWLSRNHRVSVLLRDIPVEVMGSAITDTQLAGSAGEGELAIGLLAEPGMGGPATVAIDQSYLARHRVAGINVDGSTLTMRRTMVIETRAGDIGPSGSGMSVLSTLGTRPSVEVSESVLAANQLAGIVAGEADVSLDAVVIRDTLPLPPEQYMQGSSFGHGFSAVVPEGGSSGSSVVIANSLFERNHEVGIYAAGASLTVRDSRVHGTLSSPESIRGEGVRVQQTQVVGIVTDVTIEGCLIEDNRQVGIALFGDVTGSVSHSLVRNTMPREAGGGLGWGLAGLDVEAAGPSIAGDEVVFENNHEAGIAWLAGTLSLSGSTVRWTEPVNGLFGDGVVVLRTVGEGDGPSVRLMDSTVEDNRRAGVGVFGGTLEIGDSALRCNAFDLTAEAALGFEASVVNLGDNACGCDASVECKVVSAGLSPVEPLDE